MDQKDISIGEMPNRWRVKQKTENCKPIKKIN